MQAHLDQLGSKVPEVTLDLRVQQGSQVSKVNRGQLAREAQLVMQDSQAQMDSQEMLEMQVNLANVKPGLRQSSNSLCDVFF